MKEKIHDRLAAVAGDCGIDPGTIQLGYPEDPAHGDLTTNLAMANAKRLKADPRALAEKVIAEFMKGAPSEVEAVEIAGPGVINFKVKDAWFAEEALKIADDAHYGQSHSLKGQKVMVEYTDPNPFKVFHIGHLMSNAIGESVSRLIQSSGAEVIRACYQGDVGLHVAKTIWAIMKKGVPADLAAGKAEDEKAVKDKVAWLGERYAEGASHDDDPEARKEILEMNKKIFDRSDDGINRIYDYGRKVSLEYFDSIYARLGTRFDRFFFESEVDENGLAAVNGFLDKGVFEKSDGAVVFKGEKHGLHTRVFITSQGLPTYEAKELGLNAEKFKLYPDLRRSIIVTANEQSDYFKVLLKVLSLIRPDIAEKTRHMSHGILRFTTGKMSSRKGNVISAEQLIDDIRKLVKERIEDEEVCDEVAIAAIKYTILRQAIGGDVIFDSASSISFEGDSGPYLQYSAVRANSVIEKAETIKSIKSIKSVKSIKSIRVPEKVGNLERLLSRFPDVAERARQSYAPQIVANYLTALAAEFNSFYGRQVILDENDPLSPYHVALTRAFKTVMANGLWLLGIKVPRKM
ncbi:MAG: arginine--tRNA ligase [Patescibacteria group bacterium]|nr:arginine--tRNA ligase [Patescibacteria group bacterium]